MARWLGEVVRGTLGNWAYAVITGGAVAVVWSAALNLFVGVPLVVLLTLGLLVLIAMVLGWVLLLSLITAPQPSALAWSLEVDEVAVNETRGTASSQYVVKVAARRDVRLEAPRVHGKATLGVTTNRRSLAAGESFYFRIAFEPVAVGLPAPSRAYAILEQPYRIAGGLRTRTARALLHIVFRWDPGRDPLLEAFDDNVPISEAMVDQIGQGHWDRNEAWYGAWSGPNTGDADRSDPRLRELDRLLEEGDGMLEALKRDQQSLTEESWPRQAETFLQLPFPSYVIHFNTPRNPLRVPVGLHTVDVFPPLDDHNSP